jgi:hypothetical protein
MDAGLDLWEAEKAISITYSDCVSIALVIQYQWSCTTLSFVACPSLPYFSTAQFLEKKLLNMKRVL